MFVHRNQLRHLLRPDQYYSQRQYDRELQRVLLPAWHVVATKAELPDPGDFLTCELLGQPVLLRNMGGEYHAFLNVCAHRHCLLAGETRGHSPALRCQYHGWEYTREGRTGKIPDAGCFRPFDRDNARLKRFRTATCGELIFVSLSDDGPSLAEHLGAYWDRAVSSFDGTTFALASKYEATYRANWKVPLENSLETYHVPCLHTGTFGEMPPEPKCEHDLDATFTAFRVPVPPDWFSTRFMRWAARRMGVEPAGLYVNHHAHPNVTFTRQDILRVVQCFLPTSPTTCRHLSWLYTIRGPRRGPLNWLVARFLRWVCPLIDRKVLGEDARIFEQVQRGLPASPHRGVLGTREERLYAFQEYVARLTGDPPLEGPQAALTPAGRTGGLPPPGRP
jgi:choline monooxygenase